MKKILLAICLSTAGATLGFGCSGTVATASDYNQSCVEAADCVAVIDGDVCCGCPNAAINKDAKADYDADLGECEEQCDIFCEATVVSCIEGTCAVAAGEPVCDAGSETFCKCSADQNGTTTCKEDGSGFGDCVC